LNSLTDLFLHEIEIDQIEDNSFNGLTGLVYLNLSDNPIYSKDREAFKLPIYNFFLVLLTIHDNLDEVDTETDDDDEND
ncbi:hypothetical protein BpHYR1_016580, partial [Brachionus plicatilis]